MIPSSPQPTTSTCWTASALLAPLRRHDRNGLEARFPATLAAVHDHLVAQDEAEDRDRGWG